jgi:alpha-L-arabinofuranosidase
MIKHAKKMSLFAKHLLRLPMVLFLLTLLWLGAFSATQAADPGKLTIKVNAPGAQISPTLYGLMTEEINHSYDGGLYAELVQNRSFKDGPKVGQSPDPHHPPHWSLIKTGTADGAITLDSSQPVNTTGLSTSLRLDVNGGEGKVGVANDGYWGIPVKPHTSYHATFYARANVDLKQPLTVAFESDDGQTVTTATVEGIGQEWKKYEATLNVGEAKPSTTNRLIISTPAGDKCSVWLSLVSLFPPTYNNRPNGLRPDLMQLLGGMKPAFLRFPGGNYLEGNIIEERFDWKKTIGPIEDRPGHICPWGYRSSDGLGLLEFLTWCEDLKMQPLLAVYAGYSLQQQRVNSGNDLQPFVKDALDEIEYVTGGPDTTWGARRVKDGHPQPFQLAYVEVGNEDNFDNVPGSYEKRFAQYFDAIKTKYPALKIIATMPIRDRQPDLVDDHYYRSAVDMERDADHYDALADSHPKFSRTGPKVFVGEWATTEGRPTPTLQAALGDAAWMTGMERNSDVILMSCYAPLLVNVNRGASQWGTNLIGYDALASFGSPSYYAQKMFSENRGDRVLPVQLDVARGKPPEIPLPSGKIGVGTWATQSEYKDMKVTVGDKVVYSSDSAGATDQWQPGDGEWSWDKSTLRQESNNVNCRDTVGDTKWSDYVYTLKARKISGNEGFLVMFHVQDDDNWLWWNIGGWNNSRTVIQKTENGASRELGRAQNVTVDIDRWYDIKIETQGRHIRCYLDGKLLSDVDDAPEPLPLPMYATASRDDGSGDVILKVVNTEGADRPIEIQLEGIDRVAPQAQVEMIAGQPDDVNRLADPAHVAIKTTTIQDAAARFTHTFPAYSVTVMRFKPQ